MNNLDKNFICKEGVNFLGLLSIGIFCFLYSIFASDFAEWHLQPPFLDFPVFIGEFLLFFCILLFFVRSRMVPISLTRWHIILLFYLGWLLINAFHGYLTFGPLAFRNAALFYYPLFGVFGYMFYDKKFFSQKYVFLLLSVLGLMLTAGVVNDYFCVPYIILFIVLASHIKKKWIQYISMGFIAMTVLFNHQFFFGGSRSHLMGVLMSFFYIIYFMAVLTCIKIRYKLLGLSVVLCIFILGVFKFSDKNAVRSLIMPIRLMEEFKDRDVIVQTKKENFSPRKLPVKLYNDNRAGPRASVEPNVGRPGEIRGGVPATVELDAQRIEEISQIVILEQSEDIKSKISSKIEESKYKILKEFRMTLEDEENAVWSHMTERLEQQKEKILKDIQHNFVLASKPAVVLEAPDMKSAAIAVPLEETARIGQGIIERQAEDIKGVAPAMEHELKEKFVEYLESVFDEEATLALKENENGLAEKIKKVVRNSIERPAPSRPQERSLGIAYGNMIFRLLIWRDMLTDLLKEKAVWGINWGRSQRSPSIEILGLARGEWTRDGWITPHNSYLHMIYRAGIIGLLMVISIFGILIKLTRDFIKMKSLVGGLLVGSLVYWLTISNFLVFLEFPYNAIPFWSLFGMTLAYAHEQVREFKEKAKI